MAGRAICSVRLRHQWVLPVPLYRPTALTPYRLSAREGAEELGIVSIGRPDV